MKPIILLLLALAPFLRAADLSDLIWVVSDGEVTITDCDEGATGNLDIPDTIGGLPVTSIGDGAFSSCGNLTNIVLPDSLTSFGPYAFSNCSSLINITIPVSVNSIGHSAFCDCDSLITIGTAPDNPGFQSVDGVLFNNNLSDLIAYPAGKPDFSYQVPPNVTSISDSAFKGCDNLTQIFISESVTEVGVGAFQNCTGLTSISIPDRVTSLGWFAFQNCPSLKNISLGKSISLEEGLYEELVHYFDRCPSLINVEVDPANPTLQSLEGVLFNKSLSDLIFYPPGRPNSFYLVPNSVTWIEKYSFSNSHNLTRVVIPDSVSYIDFGAFMSCSSLQRISLGHGISSLDPLIFESCTNLTSIDIPDNVRDIQYAFDYCPKLTKVSLGNSISNLGEVGGETFVFSGPNHSPFQFPSILLSRECDFKRRLSDICLRLAKGPGSLRRPRSPLARTSCAPQEHHSQYQFLPRRPIHHHLLIFRWTQQDLRSQTLHRLH